MHGGRIRAISVMPGMLGDGDDISKYNSSVTSGAIKTRPTPMVTPILLVTGNAVVLGTCGY